MDDLTRTVLEDVARLKRQGNLPTRCPACGCGEQGHHTPACPSYTPTYTLRDHAADPEAFDRSLAAATGQQVTLRVLTTEHPEDATAIPAQPTCTGTMVCDCPSCIRERVGLVKRGGQGEGNASPFVRRSLRRAA